MRRLWLLAVVLVAASSCAAPQFRRLFPTAELVGVDVVDVSFTDMALAAHLIVHNARSRPLSLEGYTWELALGEQVALRGSDVETRRVPAGGDLRLQVPVAFHFPDLLARRPALRGRRRLPYRLTVRLGRYIPPVTYSAVLTVPQAPTVRLRGLHVRGLSPYEATVQVDLTLEAPPGAALGLRGVDCALALEGRPILHVAADALAVPVQGVVAVPLTAHVPLGAGGRAVAAILRRHTVSFHLTGHAMLHADAFGVLRLPIDRSGVIPLSTPGA